MKAACFFILGCVVSSSLAAQLAPAGKKNSSPDVYLVTIDTLRADHVHCYGYQPIQTPTLDELAKDGIRFQPGPQPDHQVVRQRRTCDIPVPPVFNASRSATSRAG